MCPRRAGRGLGVSSGRTRRDGRVRKRRMPFFPPPLEANDAGLRVTEDAPYRWTWPEIGKAIGVPEASVCSHPAIMPDFQTPAHTEFTPLFPRRCRFSRFVYPLTKEKSL